MIVELRLENKNMIVELRLENVCAVEMMDIDKESCAWKTCVR